MEWWKEWLFKPLQFPPMRKRFSILWIEVERALSYGSHACAKAKRCLAILQQVYPKVQITLICKEIFSWIHSNIILYKRCHDLRQIGCCECFATNNYMINLFLIYSFISMDRGDALLLVLVIDSIDSIAT